jgi:hypothetical protein
MPCLDILENKQKKGDCPSGWGETQDGGVMKGKRPRNSGGKAEQQQHYLKIAGG